MPGRPGGVHTASVDSDVQPARTNTQPGAVQANIEAAAWNDRDGSAKTQAHDCPLLGFDEDKVGVAVGAVQPIVIDSRQGLRPFSVLFLFVDTVPSFLAMSSWRACACACDCS